jgi:hypothetical protein
MQTAQHCTRPITPDVVMAPGYACDDVRVCSDLTHPDACIPRYIGFAKPYHCDTCDTDDGAEPDYRATEMVFVCQSSDDEGGDGGEYRRWNCQHVRSYERVAHAVAQNDRVEDDPGVGASGRCEVAGSTELELEDILDEACD